MWYYNNLPFEPNDLDPKKDIGFVYLIRNKHSGKLYVGKKLFFFKGFKKVKGKRKRTHLESDWKDYFGSNKVLQEDVQVLGVEQFERTILHICSSKSECSYYELYEQITRKAILDSNYYNDLIWVRINRKHLRALQF